MEEESKPYCHKFNRSQSNRVPVGCWMFPVGNFFLTIGLRSKLGSGLKSCSGWNCCELEQWPKTDWTWRTHGYLCPEPHLVSRLSLATIITSWNVITLSPDFSESPVIPVTFFTVIRTVFCYYLFLSVWIENIIYIFIWIINIIVFIRFWFALFLVVTCY